MKKTVIVFCIFCQTMNVSCNQSRSDMRDYDINTKFRNFISCYKTGDTLVFINSSKKIEKFIIEKIDSTLITKSNYVITPRPQKSWVVSYTQFPMDFWAHESIEMGPDNNENKLRKDYDQLITITKYQNSNR